jgi:glycerophosphoryl diester phosphodiesterase
MELSAIQSTLTPPIIAHRGASAAAPENTLAAFIKAKQLGINWVEFDVMLTASGEPVVFHDDELERTTNGSGSIIQSSYDYLKTLDAGSWFHPVFANQQIPLLEEVLSVLHQQQLAANLEIKVSAGQENILVPRIFEILQKNITQLPSPLLISSFSLTALKIARKISPSAILGMLLDEWQNDWQDAAMDLQCISIHVNQTILNPARVSEIKEKGYLLLTYTVNTVERATELLSWGVDAIFSDCPPALLTALKV